MTRQVKIIQSEADAWIIFAGPRDSLEWFASGPIPAFVLYGRQSSANIAATGPVKLAETIPLPDAQPLLTVEREFRT